ncbi:MAG: urate hydroxylase PuuD [Gammaproteobacteria bacterium]|nr:urate hydroxylase PuuD [Gammaproteobacteria bacterium]
MNPLNSITGTIVTGVVLSIIAIFVLGPAGGVNPAEFWVWMHVLVGITWIGLLYYFNFIQVPAMPAAKADGTAPGITKHIAPSALLWFRWAAVATWLTGAMALEAIHTAPGSGVVAAFTFSAGFSVIGLGAWLGTIMLLNVWGLIWPNQKKVLGMVEASDEEKAKAAKIALMASRTNTALSIPMLLAMTAFGHGLPF